MRVHKSLHPSVLLSIHPSNLTGSSEELALSAYLHTEMSQNYTCFPGFSALVGRPGLWVEPGPLGAGFIEEVPCELV